MEGLCFKGVVNLRRVIVWSVMCVGFDRIMDVGVCCVRLGRLVIRWCL